VSAAALDWVRREPPLPAIAATAEPRTLHALRAAVAQRLQAGVQLRVAGGPAGLLVLAAAQDLPWVPGVLYLGWEAGFLVPTTRTTLPAVDLLAPALRALAPPGHDLVALTPWGLLTTVAPRRSADPARLAQAQ
jgi:hypothetical protein